jgi:hypothetical protein
VRGAHVTKAFRQNAFDGSRGGTYRPLFLWPEWLPETVRARRQILLAVRLAFRSTHRDLRRAVELLPTGAVPRRCGAALNR